METSNYSKAHAAAEFHRLMDLVKKATGLRELGMSPDEAIALLEVSPEDAEHIRRTFVGSKSESAKFPDLKKGKNGDWYPPPNSPENMEHLIKLLGYSPALNNLKNRIYSGGEPLNDFDLSRISNEAKRNELNSTKDHIISVINEIGAKNSYHPFKRLVEEMPWDGQDHIQSLFETLTINPEFGENTELYFKYLKRWLIGMIAKVYSPGSQNGVLTLQGDQGKGKSKWLMKLGPVPECYGEGGINPESKDDQLKHLDFVLWHASELDGIVRKRDVAALKDFFTKSDVAVRPAYGRFDRIGKSICSFCASVNDLQFLNDITGSRRFYVIPVAAIDYKHQINIQQVFAQALALFQSGEKWWFEGDEVESINAANESFNLETPIDNLASRISAGKDKLTGSQIFEACGWQRPSHSDLTKLGALLKKKGIRSERFKRQGIQVTIYWVRTPRNVC